MASQSLINPMFSSRSQKSGFTLIELLVGVGIFAIVSAVGLVAYTQTITRTDLRAQANLLTQTLHQAQWQAMAGKSLDGENPASFGVHFESDRYVLFSGETYNPGAEDNLVTQLPAGIGLDFSLPSADLLFEAKTGLPRQLEDFGPGEITLTDSQGASLTLTINRLGVIDID